MGLETPADLGGAECSFTSAVIAIEELAKVDPSVSALCDIHVSRIRRFLLTIDWPDVPFGIEYSNQHSHPQIREWSVEGQVSSSVGDWYYRQFLYLGSWCW